MEAQSTALIPQDDWYAIIDLVTQSVDSPHSKRAYSRALIDFLDWYVQNGRPGFSKATVNAYREQLLREGKSRSSINQALAAHDLRRTAAALALRGGADLRQIQQMLGHASITMTERYLEPIRSLQVTAADFIQIELALATG